MAGIAQTKQGSPTMVLLHSMRISMPNNNGVSCSAFASAVTERGFTLITGTLCALMEPRTREQGNTRAFTWEKFVAAFLHSVSSPARPRYSFSTLEGLQPIQKTSSQAMTGGENRMRRCFDRSISPFGVRYLGFGLTTNSIRMSELCEQ